RVPPALRVLVALVVPALVAVWSLAGFYGALAPTLVQRLVGVRSPLLGGLAIFVLAGSGALTVLVARDLSARLLATLGMGALFTGVGATLVALAHGSTAAFFAGTAIAGVGFGAGFQGAIRSVLPLAAPHERAGVLSVLYVVSYLAMGLPAVVAGFRVVHGGGVLTTAREYGTVVMALAAVALLGITLRPVDRLNRSGRSSA